MPASPMFPWQSQSPAAVDALVSLLKGITAGVTINGKQLAVHDGPFLSSSSDQFVLQIGWGGFIPGYQYPSRSMSEELGGADITGDGIQEGLGPSIRETFTIGCGSLGRSGTSNEKEASLLRKTCYANAAYIGQACVATSPPLNGTVKRITMGSTHAFHLIQDRRGLLGVCTFTVRCEGYAQQ